MTFSLFNFSVEKLASKQSWDGHFNPLLVFLSNLYTFTLRHFHCNMRNAHEITLYALFWLKKKTNPFSSPESAVSFIWEAEFAWIMKNLVFPALESSEIKVWGMESHGKAINF